jgi:hypothetical protein
VDEWHGRPFEAVDRRDRSNGKEWQNEKLADTCPSPGHGSLTYLADSIQMVQLRACEVGWLSKSRVPA